MPVKITGLVATLIALVVFGTIIWLIAQLGAEAIAGDSARGILAFMFALTTIAVILIVVIVIFLETSTGTDLEQRLQKGKDILAILIGLLGAILGYYFGKQANPPSAPIVNSGPQTSGGAASGGAATQVPGPPK